MTADDLAARVGAALGVDATDVGAVVEAMSARGRPLVMDDVWRSVAFDFSPSQIRDPRAGIKFGGVGTEHGTPAPTGWFHVALLQAAAKALGIEEG